MKPENPVSVGLASVVLGWTTCVLVTVLCPTREASAVVFTGADTCVFDCGMTKVEMLR